MELRDSLGTFWYFLTQKPWSIENNIIKTEPVIIQILGFVKLRMVNTSVKVLIDSKGIVLLDMKHTSDG